MVVMLKSNTFKLIYDDIIKTLQKMKKYVYIIIVFFCCPMIVFGQKQENFNKLVERLNHCLLEYNKLTPLGGYDTYYSVNSFGLSKQEIKEMVAKADYDNILSANRDSIQKDYMIEFFRIKIEDYLDKIIKHPDFFKNDFTSLFNYEILSIVKSDDNKLLNISFDEQTGGTYRSQISKMYYIDTEKAEIIDLNQTDNSIFVPDGYNAIYTIQTAEGIKYVLTGGVQVCNTCFYRFVQVIKFSENEFSEELMVSVTSRDWSDEGVTYNNEEKAIYVNYHVDDLTPDCFCSEEKFDYEKLLENHKRINCKRKYIFDGTNFEPIESHWQIIDYQ